MNDLGPNDVLHVAVDDLSELDYPMHEEVAAGVGKSVDREVVQEELMRAFNDIAHDRGDREYYGQMIDGSLDVITVTDEDRPKVIERAIERVRRRGPLG